MKQSCVCCKNVLGTPIIPKVFVIINERVMGLVEALAVSSIIAGAFYIMNQEKAKANGATKKLRSSAVSLFVVVGAVMLLTSFFMSGSNQNKVAGGGDFRDYQTGGSLGGTPVDVAVRQISMEEPYW